MSNFTLHSSFDLAGDQPQAVDELVAGLSASRKYQTLLGVTGSGKTFTIANVLAQVNRPALVISHNKILAAQLYAEFKSFFPENAVEYFISYYDYYQPEAYVPQSDTYIDKDAAINDHIDRLRLKATTALMERRDCVIVASVSCIYGLGSPELYRGLCVTAAIGMQLSREEFIKQLIAIQYERNDSDFARGRFRARGSAVDVFPAYLETAVRVEFDNSTVAFVSSLNPLTGETLRRQERSCIYPARHFVTDEQTIEQAIGTINQELKDRLAYFKGRGKLLEAQRLEQRTRFDLEMLRETGTCHGIENYSRHLTGRRSGQRPDCLIDYFPKDFLVIIDESHVTVPQINGMYEGDRSRKQTLVDHGFRLPSALDNRPLRFNEFEALVNQTMYISATPGPCELERSGGVVTEQIIRPTGLTDPRVEVRPITGQIDDLIGEITATAAVKERTLVTTLTKRMAEDLTRFFVDRGLRVTYLHSDIKALDRIDIITSLRKGEFDVLVGVNLLREGLDIPEVSLVAVLDADKEGFLRSETSLIQVCGRAARNVNGRVILYADRVTGSMQRALSEMSRRRVKQEAYNAEHGITPRTITKSIHELDEFRSRTREDMLHAVRDDGLNFALKKNLSGLIRDLEKQMRQAADNLDFETAAVLRDRVSEIKQMHAQRKKKA